MPTARAALEARFAPGAPEPPAAREHEVASWRMTLFVIASAVSVAAVAALAVIPAPQAPGGMPAPDTAMAAAPRRSADAPARTAPALAERVAAPSTVFRPAPPANTADGADAAVRQAEGTGPGPVAAGDEERVEPPSRAVALTAAGPAVEAPPSAPFPAATAPAPSGAAEEPQPPVRTRIAGGAGAPTRTASTAAPRPAPAGEWSGEKRCRAILVRTTLGEGLSDADKEHLRRRRCQ